MLRTPAAGPKSAPPEIYGVELLGGGPRGSVVFAASAGTRYEITRSSRATRGDTPAAPLSKGNRL